MEIVIKLTEQEAIELEKIKYLIRRCSISIGLAQYYKDIINNEDIISPYFNLYKQLSKEYKIVYEAILQKYNIKNIKEIKYHDFNFKDKTITLQFCNEV